MSTTAPTIDTASPVMDTTDGDHEKMTHIVFPASKAAEAMITGNPCTALCGKVWTPTNDPDRYGVCPTCIEVFEKTTGRPWSGRR